MQCALIGTFEICKILQPFLINGPFISMHCFFPHIIHNNFSESFPMAVNIFTSSFSHPNFVHHLMVYDTEIAFQFCVGKSFESKCFIVNNLRRQLTIIQFYLSKICTVFFFIFPFV